MEEDQAATMEHLQLEGQVLAIQDPDLEPTTNSVPLDSMEAQQGPTTGRRLVAKAMQEAASAEDSQKGQGSQEQLGEEGLQSTAIRFKDQMEEEEHREEDLDLVSNNSSSSGQVVNDLEDLETDRL